MTETVMRGRTPSPHNRLLADVVAVGEQHLHDPATTPRPALSARRMTQIIRSSPSAKVPSLR